MGVRSVAHPHTDLQHHLVDAEKGLCYEVHPLGMYLRILIGLAQCCRVSDDESTPTICEERASWFRNHGRSRAELPHL